MGQLKPYFKEHGYGYQSGHTPAFIRKDGQLIYQVMFSFGSKYQTAAGGTMNISYSLIEMLILEVGLPNMDLTKYRQGTIQLPTVHHTPKEPLPQAAYHFIDKEEDASHFAHAVMMYLEQQGWDFARTYSHLPNILTEMNRLEKEGKYWNGLYGSGGILTGGSDSFFRGLIISKLCDDPDFTRKLIMVDRIFYEQPDQWLPYYERLKLKLQTLEPLTTY